MGMEVLSSRAIIGIYYEMLEQAIGSWVDSLSFYSPSDQSSEDYKWLGMSPQMREWVGGRNAKGLRDDGIIIKNKPFESTLEISVDDLRRDKTGQLQIRIGEQVDRAKSHWMKLLSTLLINAPSTVCYDGQYFFDTDHSEGESGTQDNDITVDISGLAVGQHGSITVPSVEEMNRCIMRAIQQIYSFKDDQGEPINELARKFLVMLPVPLWNIAVAAVKNQTFSSGETNTIPNFNNIQIDIAPNPRLTWTDSFAVFRTDGRTKPFIRQEESPVDVTAVAEGSELEFYHRKHHYGLYSSGNVGYGLWQHGVYLTMV